MLIGYARISTTEQNLDLQKDALLAAGCQRLFTDVASGAKAQRPGLVDALDHCRPGDVLVVWKLDRLGRSLPHLVETVRNLAAQGIGFKSLRENLDTTTSSGKLIFHIFASLAEFEQDVIRERTQAGLSAARVRGRLGGRPQGVDEKKKRAALALKKDPTRTVKEICQIVGISRNTYYKYTAEPKAVSPDPISEPDYRSARPRIMKVRLWIQVENNSKFVRGKGKAREAIEREVLSHFAVEKPDPKGSEYLLSIPYTHEDELDRVIYEEIFLAMEHLVNERHCFMEADMTAVDDPDRRW
jgi:DNA invertase Pin-like site-specific DNA recombinase